MTSGVCTLIFLIPDLFSSFSTSMCLFSSWLRESSTRDLSFWWSSSCLRSWCSKFSLNNLLAALWSSRSTFSEKRSPSCFSGTFSSSCWFHKLDPSLLGKRHWFFLGVLEKVLELVAVIWPEKGCCDLSWSYVKNTSCLSFLLLESLSLALYFSLGEVTLKFQDVPLNFEMSSE